MPAVPRSAADGTVRVGRASMVIVMLAVVPGRTVFGAPVTETSRGTRDAPVEVAAAAVGAIAVTLPVSARNRADGHGRELVDEIDATSVSATWP